MLHFWEDGILEGGEQRAEEISIGRRQVLLALSRSLQRGRRDTETVIDAAGEYGLSQGDVRAYLQDFGRRGILIDDDGELQCRVRLFEHWLRDYGVREISAAFSDTDAMMQHRRRDQELYVTPEEIDNVLEGRGAYKNVTKTADDVRAWLVQFEGLEDQRLMFKVLRRSASITGL